MNERGVSTVLVAGVVGVVMLGAVGLAAVGRVAVAHVQATAAADAAALAAAPVTFLGGDPRAEAAEFAAGNGARLVGCVCLPDRSWRARVVQVEVVDEVDLPGFGTVTVRARAAAEFDPLELIGG